jgi:hypothetical protein
MLLDPLMTQIFFGQPYLRGLVLIRQNFFWLSFFIYAAFIRDLKDVDKLLRILVIAFAIYVVILLLTKYFPQLGLIHYDIRFYDKNGMMRFGEFRLFLPYNNIPILLYFVVLARLIHQKADESVLRRICYILFALLVFYAILSTYTRIYLFSLLIATAFAFFTCKRPVLRFSAIAITFLVVSLQIMSMAMSDGGLLGETKLGKMTVETTKFDREKGRKMMIDMCVKQFLRSPILGVGTLATGVNKGLVFNVDNVIATYRKYGFFSTSDLGYPKIAAENGLVGLAWVCWFLSYFYRRGKQTLALARNHGNLPGVEALCRGSIYFVVYLAISGVTIPHFVYWSGVTILPLWLALMAVTRTAMQGMSLNPVPAASMGQGRIA